MTKRGKVGGLRSLGVASLAVLLLATACASDESVSGSDVPTSEVDGAAGSASDGPSSSRDDTNDDDDGDDGNGDGNDPGATGVQQDPVAVADDCNVPERESSSEASVELDVVSSGDGPEVKAALYPLPDYEGNPWSQWGQGTMLPDGRHISAVGDHIGEDGNSWIYEYDPATGVLERTTEVSGPLGHEPGDWGYGKVHARMSVGRCGEMIGSTYWGTRRNMVIGGSYQGDHLIRYDPASRTVESLGVPVPGHGIPSLALSPDRRWVFGEAVDPESEPDAGVFFVADAATGEVVHVIDDDRHRGFRSILVSSEGEAHYSIGGGDLVAVDADGRARDVPDALAGGVLRSATTIAPDGTVYGTTRDPDTLFALTPDGKFVDMGRLEDDAASMAVAPDGGTLYYVPGAHGGGADLGTPVIAVDVETGEHEVVVELRDAIEDALGVTPGGTYNVVVDPSGERLYVGLNAGPPGDFGETFGTVVLAVVELS